MRNTYGIFLSLNKMSFLLIFNICKFSVHDTKKELSLNSFPAGYAGLNHGKKVGFAGFGGIFKKKGKRSRGFHSPSWLPPQR
jgi:hypothetical protein